jgi:hypothetical protein
MKAGGEIRTHDIHVGKIASEACFISRNLLSSIILHDSPKFAIARTQTHLRAFKRGSRGAKR